MRWQRAAVLAVLVLASAAVAADALKSGPQVGADVPGPFQCHNVNGADAGEKACLYCKNGTNPVVMVFAREPSAPVVALIRKLDAASEKNRDDRLGTCVIFLGQKDALEKDLKDLIEKLIAHEAWAQRVPERPAVPDESRAKLTLTVGADSVTVWDWYNDLAKNKRLVEIRDLMQKIAWK